MGYAGPHQAGLASASEALTGPGGTGRHFRRVAGQAASFAYNRMNEPNAHLIAKCGVNEFDGGLDFAVRSPRQHL
jgi:hypothetical protein